MTAGLIRPLTAVQQAQRRQSLSQRLPVPTAQAQPGQAAPAQGITAPEQCKFTDHNGSGNGTPSVANPDRLTSCSDVTWTVAEYEVIDGEENLVGSLDGEDFQWTTYQLTKDNWSHGMIVKTYQGQKVYKAGLIAEVTSNCVGANTCIASRVLPYVVRLSPGSTNAFGWTEYDLSPGRNASSALTPSELVCVRPPVKAPALRAPWRPPTLRRSAVRW